MPRFKYFSELWWSTQFSDDEVPTGFYTRDEEVPSKKSHILNLKENYMCHLCNIETAGKVYFLLSVNFISGAFTF